MKIIFHGHSCFEITASPIKQNLVKIVIDPFSEEIGLKLPKMEANLLLVSHGHYDHSNVRSVSGNYFLISEPGEYEIKGVFVKAIKSFHDQKEGKERGENLIFKIEAEDLKLCHMGDLGQRELTKEQLDEISQVDILFIPVGGTYTISAKEAKEIISQIEPKIIIPMHYHLPGLKIKLDGIESFISLMGKKKVEEIEKLQIKKADLPQEGQKILILKPT